MSLTTSAKPNMSLVEIWQMIVADCQDENQKSVNCGSALRRKAIIEMNRKLSQIESWQRIAQRG